MDNEYIVVRCPSEREYTTKNGAQSQCDAFMLAIVKGGEIPDDVVVRCPTCRTMFKVSIDGDLAILTKIKNERLFEAPLWRVLNG